MRCVNTKPVGTDPKTGKQLVKDKAAAEKAAAAKKAEEEKKEAVTK